MFSILASAALLSLSVPPDKSPTTTVFKVIVLAERTTRGWYYPTIRVCTDYQCVTYNGSDVRYTPLGYTLIAKEIERTPIIAMDENGTNVYVRLLCQTSPGIWRIKYFLLQDHRAYDAATKLWTNKTTTPQDPNKKVFNACLNDP